MAPEDGRVTRYEHHIATRSLAQVPGEDQEAEVKVGRSQVNKNEDDCRFFFPPVLSRLSSVT